MLEKILNQKAMITVVLIAVLFGGLFAYQKIGKLEDAEIPFKTALVITAYPGASAHEVELEVTDVLEEAIQKLENIDFIESNSTPGMSMIEVNIRQTVKTDELPQLWDHLRRKVGDAQGHLPQGAYPTIVNDDFADTYGMFYAVSADGYSKAELTDYTEFIEKELLSVEGVRRSQIFGKQNESIEIRFSTEELAKLGINPMLIAMEMQNQGAIVNSGKIASGKDAIRLGVGNKLNKIEDIENLLISTQEGSSFRLGEIAKVQKSYFEPKREAMYFNDQQALALGLSNETGINVVELGERIDEKLAEVKAELPAGIEINTVYSQPERVDAAVQNFIWNLISSVGIVIAVLLFAMGMRSGLLISSGLVFTILATLICMLAIDLPLHRVTLSAIILAMGMLVDNSIVVADGILMDLKKGIEPKFAFVDTAKKTAIPLLGSTLVAILAFMPLALSPDMSGEFMSSLFSVLVISLALSWVFAMVQTPFMAKYFYKKQQSKSNSENDELYNGFIYKAFIETIKWSLKHKRLFVASSVLVLILSFGGFKFIKLGFFPSIAYDQFLIEYTLPQGSDIDAVERDIQKAQKHILTYDEVTKVTGSVGRPPVRYLLMRPMAMGGNNYAEFIVETTDKETVAKLIPELEAYFEKEFPESFVRILQYGAVFTDFETEMEFSGPDPAVLKDLAEQAKEILRKEELAVSITDNWLNESKVLKPIYDVEKAQKVGLTRNDMANSILVVTNGMPIGAIYEGKDQVPVVLRTNTPLASDLENIGNIPVWGQRSQASTPLAHIIDTLKLDWENEAVYRYNGKRALKVQCDVKDGHTPEELFASIKDDIEAIPLPDGYSLRWDGTVANAMKANKALATYLPLALGLMLVIIIGLFNNLKQPVIIFLIFPYAFIGVVLGFITTGATYDFMGIIGTLGLIGMMIKNAVVLLDEINLGIDEGKTQLQATIDASVSRMRPVMMASLTTILGMAPLLADAMFKSMSITIMFGLFVGTLIILILVPVFYAQFYKVDISPLKASKKEKEISHV
ncbi:efflux RND transporter permease subunit [Sediminitomix flava]|uniref:Multidrug efflux pump subunit AcrB n=1 Tax=Sediminitomix flava TaxID=379075 RepID=A0A315ZFA6_SEDFL|nr:efflux RND transporter permease subunit [Sediminitomix flava]PWJ43839.1 multidrug efflux pump subunit AcrB [Sediminitomix flava]